MRVLAWTRTLLISVLVIAGFFSALRVPRQAEASQNLPDLKISKIGTPSQLNATVNSRFNMTIANIGNASATNFNFGCQVNKTNVFNSSLTSPSFLPAGGAIGEAFNWTPPQVGSFVMACSVNLPPAFQESNFTNNWLSAKFVVGQAPLTFMTIRATLPTVNIGAGENATYSLNVNYVTGPKEPVFLSVDCIVTSQSGVCQNASQLGMSIKFKPNNVTLSFTSNLAIATNITRTTAGVYTLMISGKSQHGLNKTLVFLRVAEPFYLDPDALVYIPGQNVTTSAVIGLHGNLEFDVSAAASAAVSNFTFSNGTHSCSRCHFLFGVSNLNASEYRLNLTVSILRMASPIPYEINVTIRSLSYAVTWPVQFPRLLDLIPCSYSDFCAVPVTRAYPIPNKGGVLPIQVWVLSVPQQVKSNITVTLNVTQLTGPTYSFTPVFETIGLNPRDSECATTPKDYGCSFTVRPQHPVLVHLTFRGNSSRWDTIRVNLKATSSISSIPHLEPIWIVVTQVSVPTLSSLSFTITLTTVLTITLIMRRRVFPRREPGVENRTRIPDSSHSSSLKLIKQEKYP